MFKLLDGKKTYLGGLLMILGGLGVGADALGESLGIVDVFPDQDSTLTLAMELVGAGLAVFGIRHFLEKKE